LLNGLAVSVFNLLFELFEEVFSADAGISEVNGTGEFVEIFEDSIKACEI